MKSLDSQSNIPLLHKCDQHGQGMAPGLLSQDQQADNQTSRRYLHTTRTQFRHKVILTVVADNSDNAARESFILQSVQKEEGERESGEMARDRC